jgi:hypothetical protein
MFDRRWDYSKKDVGDGEDHWDDEELICDEEEEEEELYRSVGGQPLRRRRLFA